MPSTGCSEDNGAVLIYHIATASDWAAALDSGSYTTSTLGRTLAEEGFLHASRADQVRGVYDLFYRDCADDLILLTIDTDLLDCPWREDPVGADTFPHLYGPLSPDAVIEATPLPPTGPTS